MKFHVGTFRVHIRLFEQAATKINRFIYKIRESLTVPEEELA